MFGVPTGEFLIGVGFAIAGVGTWVVGLGVAYFLYRRWRGDGPRGDGTGGDETGRPDGRSVGGESDDEPRLEN